MVNTITTPLRVVNQVFHYYFYEKNALPRDIALLVMKIFSNPENTQDIVARSRAKYYAAKIHMEKQEFAEANIHMLTLGDAGDALSEEEHAEIAMFLLIAKSPNDQNRHVLEAGKHRNYLDELQLVIQNSYVKDKLTETLDQLKADLTKYLSQRNTNSFLYRLGFKNRQLSEAKNQLVSIMSAEVGIAKTALKGSESSQEIINIAQKLASQVAYAIKSNGDLFHMYGRAIDGPGTLGGQLALAKNALDVFAENIANQPPVNLIPAA